MNAAEYGMPQRRRRVFLIGYHESTETYKNLQKIIKNRLVNISRNDCKGFSSYKFRFFKCY
ncbi:MAG: DNA cytosine methyltransferase [Winogradskyella sp.]